MQIFAAFGGIFPLKNLQVMMFSDIETVPQAGILSIAIRYYLYVYFQMTNAPDKRSESPDFIDWCGLRRRSRC